MSNKVTLDQLQAAIANTTTTEGDSKDEVKKGVFRAENLTAEIKDSTGKVIAVIELEAKVFNPKTTKKDPTPKSSIGWYGTPIEGNYKGLPLTSNAMIFLKGHKIDSSCTVDLMPVTEDDCTED